MPFFGGNEKAPNQCLRRGTPFSSPTLTTEGGSFFLSRAPCESTNHGFLKSEIGIWLGSVPCHASAFWGRPRLKAWASIASLRRRQREQRSTSVSSVSAVVNLGCRSLP